MKKFAGSWTFHRWLQASNALVVCAALLTFSVSVRADSGDKAQASATVHVAQAGTGTVTHDRCNVRTRPSMTAEVVTQLHKGDSVDVLERKAVTENGKAVDWLRIALPASAKCYVGAKFITNGAANADAVHVRSGAGANFRDVGKLAKGDKIEVIKAEGEWVHIKPTPGCSGWIAAELVEVKAAAVTIPPPPTPVAPEPPPVVIAPPVAPVTPSTIRVTDADPDVIITYVIKDGMLRVVADAANAPGSFELMTIEADRLQWRIAYLETADLNLKRYEGKHVRVLGNLRWKKSERWPVIVVDRVDMIW